jgi:FAD synthase
MKKILTGTVIHGKKLGRTIGFPTANIEIKK